MCRIAPFSTASATSTRSSSASGSPSATTPPCTAAWWRICVLVGIGVRILNNCRIGEGALLAAGSVFPEGTNVPPRTLWAGVPAKMRRELSEADAALIRQYAQNYLDYTEIYLNEPATERGAPGREHFRMGGNLSIELVGRYVFRKRHKVPAANY